MEKPNSFIALEAEITPRYLRTARFVAAVFHLHSIDSHDWAQKPKASQTQNSKTNFQGEHGAGRYLDKLSKAGISIACVTDHMRCGYACLLAKTAEERSDVKIFPGMEVNVSISGMPERVHLLAVFPPEKTVSEIDRIFAGQRNIPEDSERRGQEEVSVIQLSEWRRKVEDEGGWLIIAHIDDTSRGHRACFRAGRKESMRMMLWDKDGKLSPDDDRQVSEEYKSLLLNSGVRAVEIMKPEDNVHYLSYVAGDKKMLRMPCVIRCDAHCVEDFADIERHTFVKVSSPTFHKVGQALRFFETRIRFKKDLNETPMPRLIGLRIRCPSGEGLFRDVAIAFNENLNCLIGPRSSGKSTIIEAIRFIFSRSFSRDSNETESFGPDFRQIARSIQVANLKDSLIEVLWERRDREKFLLSGSFQEDAFVTEVYDAQNERVDYSQELFEQDFPIRVYSWSEIEHLGRSAENQRELIDRMLEDLPEYKRRISDVYHSLKRNHKDIESKIAELEQHLLKDGGHLRRYSQCKTLFEKLNRPDVAQLFAKVDLSRARIEVMTRIEGLLNGQFNVADQLLTFGGVDEFSTIFLEEDTATVRDWWEKDLRPLLRLEHLVASFSAAGKEIETALKERRESIREKLIEERLELTKYENQVRETVVLNPEERIQTDQRETAKKRFDSATKLRTAYQRSWKELEELLTGRKSLVDEILVIQDQISGARARSRDSLISRLKEISDSLEVSIEFRAGADRSSAVTFLEARLDRGNFGQYKKWRLADRCFEMLNPIKLSRAIFNGNIDDFVSPGKEFGSEECLARADAENLIRAFRPHSKDDEAQVTLMDAAKLNVLLELQEQRWDDAVRIRRDGKPVDEMSPGGRSSVILPLLALAEKVPLVIDQPEDNLDNRMVGNTLTTVLARLKEVRQIIVATHNPNIVVGGDAEQVVVMEPLGVNEAKVLVQGSIDDDEIIQKVMEILEGGSEAFQARERRYEFLLKKIGP